MKKLPLCLFVGGFGATVALGLGAVAAGVDAYQPAIRIPAFLTFAIMVIGAVWTLVTPPLKRDQ